MVLCLNARIQGSLVSILITSNEGYHIYREKYRRFFSYTSELSISRLSTPWNV